MVTMSGEDERNVQKGGGVDEVVPGGLLGNAGKKQVLIGSHGPRNYSALFLRGRQWSLGDCSNIAKLC